MLQGMTWASPPALRIPAATSSQASALRLEITTFAPSFASSSAEERPMPRLEPVMTATFPVRSNGVFFMVASCSPTQRSSLRGAKRRSNPPFVCGAMDCFASLAMTVGLNQPAAVRDAPSMIVGVAKTVLDHGQALKIVTERGLLCHADAAMQLDRL